MAGIKLDNVSLTFKVRQQGRITFKEFLVRQMFRRSVNPVIKVRALQEISLAINEGERVGIIGHNGAGKSTLLKMLAGVYPPSRGQVTVEGRISSLFDLALGFEADASGWENIYYRGYLQGGAPRGIRGKIQAITKAKQHDENRPLRVVGQHSIPNDSRISNVEQGITNIEGKNPFLHNSTFLVRYSIFSCVWIGILAHPEGFKINILDACYGLPTTIYTLFATHGMGWAAVGRFPWNAIRRRKEFWRGLDR